MGPNHFIFDASQNQYHSRRNYCSLSAIVRLAHVSGPRVHLICLHNPVLF